MEHNETNQQTKQRIHWYERDVRNLRILKDFMSRYQISMKDLAEKTGMNRMSFTHMFIIDDALLSSIDRIFKAYGCRLDIEFEHTDMELIIHAPNLEKEINADAGRLLFIQEEMRRRQINMVELSKKMGESPQQLFMHLKKGRCKMSYLYKIADTLGTKLIFTLRPLIQ